MTLEDNSKLYYNLLKEENEKKITALENKIEEVKRQQTQLDEIIKNKDYCHLMNLFYDTIIRPIKNES